MMKIFQPLVILMLLSGCALPPELDPSRKTNEATSFHDVGGSAHVHCDNGVTEIDLGIFGNDSCKYIRESTRLHEQVHVDDYHRGKLVCLSGTVSGSSFTARDESEIDAYTVEKNYLTQILGQISTDDPCYAKVVEGIDHAGQFINYYRRSLASN